MSEYLFEESNGHLHTGQDQFSRLETGQGPRNLIQLLEAGKLHVVEAVVLERPPESSGLIALSDILDVDVYGEVPAGEYDMLNSKDWDRDDYIGYVKWLDGVTRDPAEITTQLNQPTFIQAGRLGIGPNESKMRRNQKGFKTLGEAYEASGLTARHVRGAYDAWTDSDLADHAEAVLKDLLEEADGKTCHVDLIGELNRRAKAGKGPSSEIYRRDGGWPMKYLAPRGYIDMASMGPEDYVEWGVKFMLANDGLEPAQSTIKFLALRKRAPEYQAFSSRFSFGEYRAQVRQAYEARLELQSQQAEARLKPKICSIMKEVKGGKLPAEIFQGLSAQAAIAARAKWLLVNELFPKLHQSRKLVIARLAGTDDLAEVLIRAGNGVVQDEDIEFAAARIGVAKVLWPEQSEGPYPYLVVPKELSNSQVRQQEAV